KRDGKRVGFRPCDPNGSRFPLLFSVSLCLCGSISYNDPMSIDWSPFVELVHRHQRFLLTTHVRPDPDGLGSQLALADVLDGLGRQVQMVIASSWPPRYTFLDPARVIQRYTPPGEAHRELEVIVDLDTGTWGQLGEFRDYL